MVGQVRPYHDRLVVVAPRRQFAREGPEHLRNRSDLRMIVELGGHFQQLPARSDVLPASEGRAEGVHDSRLAQETVGDRPLGLVYDCLFVREVRYDGLELLARLAESLGDFRQHLLGRRPGLYPLGRPRQVVGCNRHSKHGHLNVRRVVG